MSVGGDQFNQLIAVALLGVALAIGVGIFFLLLLLAKRTWAWITGNRPQAHREREQATRQETGTGTASALPPVTAADLYVIRSNLDAVSRQIQDFERKLRLSEAHGANIVSLKRK